MIIHFKDLKEDTPLAWRIDINATCPRCGAVAILGNAVASGALLTCDACGFSRSFNESAESIAESIIAKAAISSTES